MCLMFVYVISSKLCIFDLGNKCELRIVNITSELYNCRVNLLWSVKILDNNNYLINCIYKLQLGT